MAPCILEVSDEIVLLIFEQVSYIAPQSLLDLCQVSKAFCRLSSSLLYRSISIPPSKLQPYDATELGAGPYKLVSNMLAYSRHITVKDELNWSLFSDLISRMTRLESIRWLYWEAPFPAIIKNRLPKSWPDAKLFIEDLSIGFRTDAEEVQANDLNILKSLVSCRNIHSVKVEIGYEHPVTMRWLKDVLLSSLNLRILHLTLPRDRDGKVEWRADGLGFYDLCVQQGERLSPLTELVYEWRVPGQAERSIIPASFFDFTQIRHLELRSPTIDLFLIALKDQSLHIETLIIDYSCSYNAKRDAIQNFLSRIRGIQKLRILSTWGQWQLPISTVTAFGDTLKILELRFTRDDRNASGSGNSLYSYLPEDLDELRISCSQISSLTLGMQINNILPYDFLAALARFPELSTARIYFHFNKAGIFCQDDPRPPHISTDRLTALHIFTYLRDHKVGVKLESLEVMMSEYPRRARRVWQLPEHDRPGILFTCREDQRGNLVVEDGPHDDKDISWWPYFDPEAPKMFRGQTYPDNLYEIIEAGKEADMIMSDVGKVTAEFDDLFEEPEAPRRSPRDIFLCEERSPK